MLKTLEIFFVLVLNFYFIQCHDICEKNDQNCDLSYKRYEVTTTDSKSQLF